MIYGSRTGRRTPTSPQSTITDSVSGSGDMTNSAGLFLRSVFVLKRIFQYVIILYFISGATLKKYR